MLIERVRIDDIDDVERMARSAVGTVHHKFGLIFTPDEWEEMTAEAIALIVELRHGYDGRGTFGGYVARFLPGKLAHRYQRLGSLHSDDLASVASVAHEDDHHLGTTDFAGRLMERRAAQRERAIALARDISNGGDGTAIGLSRLEARRLMRMLMRASPAPRHRFARVSELRVALEDRDRYDVDVCVRIVELLEDGASATDLRDVFGLSSAEVSDYLREVAAAIE